jgi:hypothetical protein
LATDKLEDMGLHDRVHPCFLTWVKDCVDYPLNTIYEKRLKSMAAGAFLWMIIILFVVTALLQWLWNITFPKLFGWSTITYWEAFRIMIIADLLFGGSHIMFQNNGFGQSFSFHL